MTLLWDLHHFFHQGCPLQPVFSSTFGCWKLKVNVRYQSQSKCQVPIPTKKDMLPYHHQNNVIYQFVFHCDSRYVGCTSERLEERIKQHIPKSITNPPTPHIRQSLPCPGKDTSPWQLHESAIAQHLLDNVPVPYITMTNSLSSLKPALHFISPPWKWLSSNLWILFSANKKNYFTPRRSPKPLKLSTGLLFQRFDEVQITSSTNDNSPFLIS